MNIKTERELLKQDLDKVEDKHLLEAIRGLLEFGKTGIRKTKPLTEDELYDRILESRKAIADGKLITQEEAKEYFRSKNEGRN
jgi:hypothetical protein